MNIKVELERDSEESCKTPSVSTLVNEVSSLSEHEPYLQMCIDRGENECLVDCLQNQPTSGQSMQTTRENAVRRP